MPKNAMRVLVADDEEGIRFVLRNVLTNMGYEVVEAADGARALDAIHSQDLDLAILDINMPEVDGLEIIRQSRHIAPDLICLVITAYGSGEINQKAFDEGAYDYFTKPFDLQELRVIIRRALEKKSLLNEQKNLLHEKNGLLDQIKNLKSQVNEREHITGIIGSCDAMQEIFELLQRVMDNDVPVLITGESGTGKELVMKAIHSGGSRARNPLVTINCAAIPEALLESELFGHEKGAFTGAVLQRPGKFEQADGGTIFLDEIGDMPLSLQAKILRVLQEHEVTRVGASQSIPVNVRLITATNKNLAVEVAEKRFRDDLYYRINVIKIEMPPLRQRLTDIPLLVDHFISIYNRRLGKSIAGITQRVKELFIQYSWPGNVRELENVLQRALVLARGAEIEPNDLPPHLLVKREAFTPVDHDRRVDLKIPMAEQVERMAEATEQRLITEALRQAAGRQEAADLLGISRKSLHNKMIKYGMMGNA